MEGGGIAAGPGEWWRFLGTGCCRVEGSVAQRKGLREWLLWVGLGGVKRPWEGRLGFLSRVGMLGCWEEGLVQVTVWGEGKGCAEGVDGRGRLSSSPWPFCWAPASRGWWN